MINVGSGEIIDLIAPFLSTAALAALLLALSNDLLMLKLVSDNRMNSTCSVAILVDLWELACLHAGLKA